MSDSASLSSASIASVLWFLKQKDQQTGPFTSQQLKEMASGGKLTPTDQLQRLGDAKWVAASAVKGLFGPAKTPEKSGTLPAAPKPEEKSAEKSGVKPPAGKPDDKASEKSGVKPPSSKANEKSEKSGTQPAPKPDKTPVPEKLKSKSDAGAKEAAKDKTPSPDKTLPVKKGKQSLVFEESAGLVKTNIDLKPGSRWPWVIAGSILILVLGGLTFLAAQRLLTKSDRPIAAKNDPDKKGPDDGKKAENPEPKEKEPVKKEDPKKEEPKKKEEKKPEPPSWRVVKHGPGRFSVDLPRSAEFFSDRGDDGREITVLRVEDDRDKDYFEVNFSTFAEKPADPKALLSKLAGKLDRENPKKKDLDLSGNPGTERIAEVQIEKVPVIIQQRTYIVGNRAYQVTAAKEKSKLVPADVDRFLNSFKLEK